jgi:hypothetical protein
MRIARALTLPLLALIVGIVSSFAPNRLDGKGLFSVPNVAMIRDYGWRGSCPAAGVTDAGIGSGEC